MLVACFLKEDERLTFKYALKTPGVWGRSVCPRWQCAMEEDGDT